MGLFGGGNRSSSSTTNNYNEFNTAIDSRQDNSGDNRGNDYSATNSNNLSAWSYDLSSTSVDTSNRSVTNITGTDGGAVEVARINAAYGRDIANGQTDGIKTIAGFGASALARMGDSATNIFQQSASNSAQAWGHTVDVASEALNKAFDTSSATLKAAQGMASSAMATYQPAEKSNADTTKYMLMAGAALAAMFIFRKG